MANYTIALTVAEEKVITYYFGDVGTWVQNQVHPQLDRMLEQVILKKVKELLQVGLPIPDTKQAIFAIIDLTPVPFPQPLPPF